MKLFKTSLLIAGAMLSASFAQAADMPMRAPPPMMVAAPPPAEDFSGWYLRGDVGVGLNKMTNPSGIPHDTSWVSTGTSFNDIGSSHMIGAGVGYAWNNWFRTDLTLEYRGGAGISGRGTGVAGVACGCPYDFAQNYHTSVSSMVGLLNGYFDLGTWSGITPFVGAGIGYANNRMGTTTSNGQVQNCGASCNPYQPIMGTTGAGAKSGLAWALMAGLAYDVNRNTKLEMGYRYMNLGTASSGTNHSDGTGCNCDVAPMTTKLVSHDFRLGMRWTPSVASAPMPEPLMRRF
jgi:opacity protein-like surface antigen